MKNDKQITFTVSLITNWSLHANLLRKICNNYSLSKTNFVEWLLSS